MGLVDHRVQLDVLPEQLHVLVVDAGVQVHVALGVAQQAVIRLPVRVLEPVEDLDEGGDVDAAVADVDDRLDALGHELPFAGGDGDVDVADVHPLLVGDELQVVEFQLLEQGHHLHGGFGQVVDHQHLGSGRDGEDAVGFAFPDGALDHQDAPGLPHVALDLQGLVLGGHQDDVRVPQVGGGQALEEEIADFRPPAEDLLEVPGQDIPQLRVPLVGHHRDAFHRATLNDRLPAGPGPPAGPDPGFRSS